MTVLVVDDEKNIRQSLKMVLESAGYRVLLAEGAQDALRTLREERADALLLDVWLPDGDGTELVEKLRAAEPERPVVMISGHGTIETAVKAVRAGAYDFLEKPLDRDRTLLTVERALAESGLRRENRRLRQEVSARYEMAGESAVMKALRERIAQVAPTKGRVLLTGESGAGKELAAYALHAGSPRAHGPFVRMNCAAIPSELVESELFGHEPGAFTGARGARVGRFEQASGGTLLLDEIGDMSASLQAKVLRALQEEEIERVGGGRTIAVDVRVIAATNKDLRAEIAAGRFREDLYFRLNVVPVHVPPLRERGDDVLLLGRRFLAGFAEQNRVPAKSLTDDAASALRAHRWPGNVRELKNAMERASIASRGEAITAADLSFLGEEAALSPAGSGAGTLKSSLGRAERDLIRQTLERHGWNVSAAARSLGMDRTHLHKKMSQFGLRATRTAR